MKLNEFSLIITSLCFSVAASAQDFFVSPTGNDLANGLFIQSVPNTQNGPFLTLARAQQAIRNLKTSGQFNQPVTIHIAPGTYQLQTPLAFDIRDSGFVGRQISWQAENAGSTTVISGGIALTNCAPSTGGIWSCPVAGLGLDSIQYSNALNVVKGNIPGFNLYVNQQRLHLARWPDTEWAHIKVPLDNTTTFSTFEQLPAIQSDLPHAQVHILPGSDWFDQYLPVLSVNQSQNVIKLGANTIFQLASGRRFYLQNLKSQLNAPGEWFYDQPNSRILFIPPEGMTPENIVVSSQQNLISLNGANYINFQNMAFRHSTDIAISIKNSSNVLLDSIEINNVDTSGIQAVSCSYITVSNSHIHDTGQAGVLIDGGNRTTLQPSNNLVYNNHFDHFGAIIMFYMPAISASGVGSRMANNLIEQAPGSGVLITGNDHVFEKNEVSNVCAQGSDCGAIYSGRNWTYRGNTIRYNSIHDIYGYGLQNVDVNKNIVQYGSPAAVVGVYMDDAVSSYSVIGNIFNNAGNMAIQMGGGRDNVIQNNVFNTTSYAIYTDNRWPTFDWGMLRATLTQVPYLSRAWTSKYPALAAPMKHDTWPEGNTITNNVIISNNTNNPALQYILPAGSSNIADNLVWSINGIFSVSYSIVDRLNQNGAVPWKNWINLGIEKNSINADPCATITGNRVTFCANSPVNKIGFKPLPTDIGLIR